MYRAEKVREVDLILATAEKYGALRSSASRPFNPTEAAAFVSLLIG